MNSTKNLKYLKKYIVRISHPVIQFFFLQFNDAEEKKNTGEIPIMGKQTY